MSELISPSLLGMIAQTIYGMIPLGYTESMGVNAIFNSEEVKGFGDAFTKAVVKHGGNFQGNLGHAVMLRAPLTRLGVQPTRENFMIIDPFSLFLPAFATGEIFMAVYSCLLRSYNRNMALNRAVRGQASFICLNVVDGWQIDGRAPGGTT